MASVSVHVGKEACQRVAATDTAITCDPPASAPEGTDNTGKAPVLVGYFGLCMFVWCVFVDVCVWCAGGVCVCL